MWCYSLHISIDTDTQLNKSRINCVDHARHEREVKVTVAVSPCETVMTEHDSLFSWLQERHIGPETSCMKEWIPSWLTSSYEANELFLDGEEVQYKYVLVILFFFVHLLRIGFLSSPTITY